MKRKKETPDLAEYCAGLDLVDRLAPRDGFSGGRTEVLRTFAESLKDEDVPIVYLDVVSLYPQTLLLQGNDALNNNNIFRSFSIFFFDNVYTYDPSLYRISLRSSHGIAAP